MAPDSWKEVCKVDFAAQSGSNIQFQALTETIDIDLADKDIEGIALVNGGRVAKYVPQGDTEITLECYPVQAGTSSGTIGYGFFGMFCTEDTSQPISITNDRTRNNYRLAILWTDSSAVTAASDAVNTGNAFRFVAADGYLTSVKPSFTDSILKFTVKYKVTAFDKSANGNMKYESIDNTGTLAALAAYTSSAKW